MLNTKGYSGSVSQAKAIQREPADTLEFPERPGALGAFLAGMKPDWNISLFHYRNHGAGSWSLRVSSCTVLIS